MRIPQPGDVWERWDGEVVLVVGLVLNDEGEMLVEYETSGPIEDVNSEAMGRWFGVARELDEFPPPLCFVYIGADADIQAEHDKAQKLAALERAGAGSDGSEPIPVRMDEKE